MNSFAEVFVNLIAIPGIIRASLGHFTDGDGDRMNAEDTNDVASGGQATAAQLNNIRLKLEEKRRRMEQEKRRMELALNRQRQQLGQQAFLQAVTRVSLVWMIIIK